jgi:hypothetical protein
MLVEYGAITGKIDRGFETFCSRCLTSCAAGYAILLHVLNITGDC